MNLSPLQARERHRLVHIIKTEVLTKLRTKQEEKKQETVLDIITRNIQLLGSVSPSFLYEGNLYTAAEYNPRRKTIGGVYFDSINTLLHPSLYLSMKQLMDKTMAEQSEIALINQFINMTLLTVKNMDDLYILFGSENLPPIAAEPFNTGDPMTPAEMQAFKDKYRDALIAYRRIFLKQLLLG